MKMSLNCFYKLCKQLTNKILIKEVKVPGGIVFTFLYVIQFIRKSKALLPLCDNWGRCLK